MNRPAALLAALLAASAAACAQSGLGVELILDESSYLPGEAIPVGVKITNLSGRPVTFGASQDWLNFYVERRDGTPASRLAEIPVQGEFTLESATAGTKRWNLAQGFDLTQPGPYTVFAEVSLPGWSVTLTSPPEPFVVANASTLWEADFGLPGGTPGRPEIRRYGLLQANRRKELTLFVRVTDESGAVIHRVTPVDRLVSFSRPEHQLDRESNLHILFQNGARQFSYTQVNPDGDIIARQTHELVPGSRPRLAVGTNGAVNVTGGVRRMKPTDLPPPGAASTNAPPVAAESVPPAAVAGR